MNPLYSLKLVTIFSAILFIMPYTLSAEEAPAVVEEAIEEAVEAPEEILEVAAPVIKGENDPTVYIVPLGKEFNLKVTYDHAMDFEGGDHLESVTMETTDGRFLGLKQYHARSPKAYAEFLVNPELADFTEVVLIAKSTTVGEIRTLIPLELTPEELLPDEINPKKRRAAIAKARAEAAAAKASGKPVKKSSKTTEKKSEKKKRFGIF